MLKSQTNCRESGSLTTPDRRREPRAMIEFPIEVSGFDMLGQFHTEYTKTCNVSLSGCSFHLNMAVEKGLILALRVFHPENGRETELGPVLFQIVHAVPRTDGYYLGVLRLQPVNPRCVHSRETADSPQPTH